jgi:Cu+-exporting ATPase
MAVNTPIRKVAMQFRQKDGLLTSYASVKEFSDVECVVVEAEKLFPAGSVEMTNLRAFGDSSIEDIILKSADLK